MRHLTSFVSICLLLSFAACKKNSPGDYIHANPANEFKATVSETGKPDISIVANGDYTIFAKDIYGGADTIITVAGSNDLYQVVLRLQNIRTTGTYNFVPAAGADPRQYAGCSFYVGTSIAPTRLCVSTLNSVSETVTITTLTATHIAGSFSVTCSDANGDVLVKNVTFKGDFN